jgi:hypothetical protein
MKNKPLETTARASYENHILTLDLPRALQPMLWRQEIKNISNVSFWLAEQPNGERTLLMKISSGPEQTIARFTDIAAAEESLGAVREIFINGKVKKSFWWKLIKIIVWVLVIWFVGTFFFQLIYGINMIKQGAANAPHAVTESAPAPPPPAMSLAPAAPPQITEAPAAPASTGAPPTGQ